MTPQQPTPAPWWQTIVTMFANLGLTILANHFLGPIGAAATLTAGTAVAHALPNPQSQAK